MRNNTTRNNKAPIVIVVTFAIVVIVSLPYLIDLFIFGNDVPSNITNAEWASFLGGYTGAIATLLGICATILYSRKESLDDRAMQVRPYLQIEQQSSANTNDLHNNKMGEIRYRSRSLEKPNQHTSGITASTSIKFRNVGIGPAVDFVLLYKPEMKPHESTSLIVGEGFGLRCKHLSKDEHRYLAISTVFDESEITSNRFPSSVEIGVVYKDILQNIFVDTLFVEFDINQNTSTANKSYSVNLDLKEVRHTELGKTNNCSFLNKFLQHDPAT